MENCLDCQVVIISTKTNQWPFPNGNPSVSNGGSESTIKHLHQYLDWSVLSAGLQKTPD